MAYSKISSPTDQVLRVLHITRDFPPRVNGGLSTAVGGMVRASTEVGIDCAVISFDGWRPRANRAPAPPATVETTREGTPVFRVSSTEAAHDASRFADSAAPDIVHVHHEMLGEFATEIAERSNAHTVATMHVLQRHQNQLRGVDRHTHSLAGQEALLASADLLLAPSRFACEQLACDYPSAVPKLRLTPLAVDDHVRAQRAAASARTGHAVAFVGRFSDLKGLSELLAAIPMVLQREPLARFVIAGGLPDSPRRERRWLRHLDRSIPAQLRSRIELLGWVPPDQLSDLYERAAAVAAPSWTETFGLVTLEAMLHGAPIVATRAGATEELVQHGKSALLCQPRCADELAHAILALLRDRDLAGELGRAAAHEARASHLWSQRIGDVLNAYRELRTSA